MASVKCDGKCDADYQPLSCSGGKLEGGCKVDAHCQANCNASAQAKADCSPPELTVELQGSANADVAGKIIATLKANLPLFLAIKAKFDIVGTLAGTLTANISVDTVADIKAACIPIVAATVADVATKQIPAIVSVSGQISGSVGTGS
jgi:hypothetical protein